jgi:hypothetical protein
MEHITSREERHKAELGYADLEEAIRTHAKAPKNAEVGLEGLTATVTWKVELP